MEPAKRIYLQWHEPEGDGTVTWCEERIHKNDIVYIREDVLFSMLTQRQHNVPAGKGRVQSTCPHCGYVWNHADYIPKDCPKCFGIL